MVRGRIKRGAWWEPDPEDLRKAHPGAFKGDSDEEQGPQVTLPTRGRGKLEKRVKGVKFSWERALRGGWEKTYDLGVNVRGEYILALEELADEAGVPVEAYLEWLLSQAIGDERLGAFRNRLMMFQLADLEEHRNQSTMWERLE